MSKVQSRNQIEFKTWSKSYSENPVAGGKTAGTFNKSGTIKIPNKDIDVYLYGLLVNLVGTTVTAGESGFPIVRVESEDIGLVNEDFPLPQLGFIDPIGTNTKTLPKRTVFIPIEVIKKINNKSFNIYLSSSATMTVDWNGYVSGIFGNLPKNNIPQDYALELIIGYSSFVSSLSRYKSDVATAYAAAHVDVALTDIPIPAKAKLLTSVLAHVTPNAPTAGEQISGLMIFNAGDISDFGPQEYPCCVSYEASLGTPVGTSHIMPARGYPVRFKLPGTAFNFSAKFRNILILTVAPDLCQAVEFKTFEPK